MTKGASPPLDSPYPERPHRVYVALTNHCNRACPWCSTCSSPAGRVFIGEAQFLAALPAAGDYELQLEGGEPTLHPDFSAFVARARRDPRCQRLIVCTNGSTIPRDPERLVGWLASLPPRTIVKLSVNHHLLEHDPRLLDLAVALVGVVDGLPGELGVVFNVRLRRGVEADDRVVREAVAAAGLIDHANVFFLQRYGFATDQAAWELPRLYGENFRLINPDGRNCGIDLVARSEQMRSLP